MLKISDWGHAKTLKYQEIYHLDKDRALPIRWMAPEALLDKYEKKIASDCL